MVNVEEEKNVYRIEGFSCANCAGKFERNVQQLPGVEEAKVNFGASKLSVSGKTTIEELERAGAFENLKVLPEKPILKDDDSTVPVVKPSFFKKYRSLTIASTFLLLALSATVFFEEGSPVPPLLFVASMLASGTQLFKTGFSNLLKLEFDMKTLMTVAVLGGAAIGEWTEIAIVVILFALSEELERFSMDRARSSIRSLMDIVPKQAIVRRDGVELTIPVGQIVIGDTMIVKPGQKIAMDGRILRGHSSINQASITGESVPVDKSTDDNVFAGTLNGEGLLEIAITKLVEDTTIAKIIHLVEEAQGERAPAQAFVDRFAKYYTPVIMAVAALVVVVPPVFFDAPWEIWIYQGLAVLVVGCPCALVISTPIAIVSAIGNAAKQGVLIKGGIHLEEMGTVKAIAFDKTGTLTKGVPAVTDFIQLDNTHSEQDIWAIVAALEHRAQHPLASAFLKGAEAAGANHETLHVEGFASITGKGITGVIAGITYQIGSPKLFSETNADLLSDDVRAQLGTLQQQGKTVMFAGTEQGLLALFAVADEVRETSKSTIAKLHALGMKQTIMLTGDNKGTAEAIGAAVGVRNVYADLMPEQKLDAIKQLKKDYEKVAMVGDGVNDAPALAASTVGIAMGGAGTDTALETADIALMADDLQKLPFTIKLSRKTLAIIKANIIFAISIKFVALLLVVPGWLTLWIAIASDMGATLLVALNGMRLMRVKSDED
ncbi:heavy metal translocating P-type ATPase [Planomicrobium sp. YIM 101495]|uniref:heavy metal translocating P-type ATPase n=1 Tax=Planomicrobium sp. YIM 101495 TaxID=2665160 RepID=UPI0012B9C19F|nr:heavy metal translocating P-type ATPase [Planomicrobium sp. YIM 101495]MTD30616.1 heavy metal translocating P-type ATPase [Planomicrobium sp. YIM 101495]